MKRIFTAIVMLFFLTVSSQAISQDLKKLDEKYGFRDAIFESDFSTFNDMALVEESPNSKYYKRTSDNLTLGDAQLEGIFYGFYKGKLSSIIIKTKGLVNSSTVLEAFKTQYGPGYQSNRYMNDFSWYGKRANLSYDENSATKDATIYMSSQPIADQRAKDEKEAAKKAAADL